MADEDSLSTDSSVSGIEFSQDLKIDAYSLLVHFWVLFELFSNAIYAEKNIKITQKCLEILLLL